MTKTAFVVVCILLSSLLGAQAKEATANADKEVAEARLGADHFIAGSWVRADAPVAGDLIAAGGNVDVGARVDGDAVVAGGKVRVNGALGNALYAGAGELTIDGTVANNARIAGGRVELGPRANVGGNLSVAGGQVGLLGEVKGYVQAAGGKIYINGPVGGDVVAAGGQVELGPQARIAGALRYASREELRRDPAAQVAGGVERMPVEFGRQGEVLRGAGWVWTAGLMLLAAVLVAAAPAFIARVTRTLQTRIGWSLLIGFIALVCVPVAIVVLLVTIIGIPVALLTLALHLALLLAGYVVTGIGVGDWVLKRWRGATVSTGWRVMAAILAVLVIALLGRIPFIGGLIVFAVLLAGLGALVMQLRPARARL